MLISSVVTLEYEALSLTSGVISLINSEGEALESSHIDFDFDVTSVGRSVKNLIVEFIDYPQNPRYSGA